MLETFDSRVRAARAGATPSPEVVDVDDSDGDARGAPERRLAWRRRRKRMTKKQLNGELKACQSSLEACVAEEETRFLFIQMAETCTLRMEGNRTFFSTTDMDIDTYGGSSVPATMP